MSKTFGKHLRDLRKNNSNYSQQEMADMLNISRSTYTDYNTLLGYADDKSGRLVAAEDGDSTHAVSELTAREEQIILAYRSMNSEEKEFIGKQITKIVSGN